MWFEQLTGFKEESPENVRSKLSIEDDSFYSKVNGRRFSFGSLQIPTLAELKQSSPPREIFKDKLSIEEIVADVQELHIDIENSNAVFQAASQFNLLEMIAPHISPEQGVDRYENDHTQGPACAIVCGAGTIYRNYFVKHGNQIGQTDKKQINCLDLIAQELNNDDANFWQMRNGYALANQNGLLALNKKIASLNSIGRESLKDKLKVGIQWNTEVTNSITKHKVTQVYCSALPVAYCQVEPIYWESFARIVLEATYEATLYAALLNYLNTNSALVYLTLVGGGAFGNEEHWIFDSLERAISKFRNTPLQIKLVSYGQSNVNLANCLNSLRTKYNLL